MVSGYFIYSFNIEPLDAKGADTRKNVKQKKNVDFSLPLLYWIINYHKKFGKNNDNISQKYFKTCLAV